MQTTSTRQNRKLLARCGWLLCSLLALSLVALVYWPVLNGSFVWTDVMDFVDNDWLTRDEQWQHYVLRDFNGWVNYFRPLVVAFFAAQLRIFHVRPQPMHLISLALHLANCLLIGQLARLCSRAAGHAPRTQALWFALGLLLYGLHPVLVEVVAWIGCQFDLIATLFMLLGLLASSVLQKPFLRSISVAVCFFLAACSKESAVTFPLMLLIFDWALQSCLHGSTPSKKLQHDFIRRNTPVLAAIFVAGLAYLAFRCWGLGYLTKPEPLYGGELPLFGHIQRAAYTYMQYWRMLLWPTYNLNPLHDFDYTRFNHASPLMLFILLLGIAIPAVALYATLHYRSALACIVLAVTASLLPVVNLLPTGFNLGLYQERYVINALAMACMMLPLIRPPALPRLIGIRWQAWAVALSLAWLAISTLSIRSTLPLWRTDLDLWHWAYSENRNLPYAQTNFIAALVRDGKIDEADAIYGQITASGHECAECAIDIASAETEQGRLGKAAELLERARTSHEISTDKELFSHYLLAQGELALAQGNYADAASLLENRVQLTPNDVESYANLSVALSNLGQHDRAVGMADKAIAVARQDQLAALHAWRQNLLGMSSSPIPSTK